MTFKKTGSVVLLALAGALFTQQSALAQTALTYTNADLFLAFRTTGSSTPAGSDYLVNIGQASQFLTTAGPFTLSIGNIGADLVSLFGPTWYSRSDLFWSVSGGVGNFAAVGADPAKTLYASIAELTPGTYTDTPWNRGSSSSQNGTGNKMTGLSGAYVLTAGNQNFSTTNSPVGFIQSTSATNSYASYQKGGTIANSGPAPGISFAVWNPTIEGDFTNGSAGTALDLIRLTVGSGAGDIQGRFSINDGGNVAFTGAAVPEPASFGLVAFGAAALLSRRQRRQVIA